MLASAELALHPPARETFVCPSCHRHDRMHELRTEIVAWHVERMFTNHEAATTEVRSSELTDDTGATTDLVVLADQLRVATNLGIMCACGFESVSNDGTVHDATSALDTRHLDFETLYGYDHGLYVPAASAADCESPELIGRVISRLRAAHGGDATRKQVVAECVKVWGCRS